MAKRGSAGSTGSTGSKRPAKAAARASGAGRGAPAEKNDRPAVVRLTASEYQLVSYAASKTKARGLNAFLREAVVEAARHAAGKEMADDILSGRGTVRLLRESLADARGGRKPSGR